MFFSFRKIKRMEGERNRTRYGIYRSNDELTLKVARQIETEDFFLPSDNNIEKYANDSCIYQGSGGCPKVETCLHLLGQDD